MINICLITGASSGLGKAFAKLYAKEGCNLLLVGTNQERLEETRKEALEINEGLVVDYLVCDLSQKEELKRLYNYTIINDYFVNKLINNAGFGDRCDFKNMDIDFELKMTEVNCNAPLYLSRVFLDNMLKNNEGLIINVASIAGLYPGPFMSTYHCTKAFLVNFSEAITYELKDTKIKVFTLCPGPFNSRFVEKAHNDFTFKKKKPIEAMDVATKALKKVKKGKKMLIVGFKNRFEFFLSRLVPRSLMIKSSAKNLVKGGKSNEK